MISTCNSSVQSSARPGNLRVTLRFCDTVAHRDGGFPQGATVKKQISREERIAEFWSLVEKRGADECWPFSLVSPKCRYGAFSFDGQRWQAHRLAWFLTHGPIEKWILHHCDNSVCCNPAHLYQGDHSDNTRDMIERGRCRYPKLNREMVMQIRADFLLGMSRKDIARKLNLNKETVANLIAGKSWKHIPIPSPPPEDASQPITVYHKVILHRSGNPIRYHIKRNGPVSKCGRAKMLNLESARIKDSVDAGLLCPDCFPKTKESKP